MTRYTPHEQFYSPDEKTVVTTPFLIDVLDSALIEHIQLGNIEAAFGVLDLSISLSQTLEGNTLTEAEGKDLLAKVRKAMASGNIATAKQHMVEFALR
jgi:hypothetical protein